MIFLYTRPWFFDVFLVSTRGESNPFPAASQSVAEMIPELCKCLEIGGQTQSDPNLTQFVTFTSYVVIGCHRFIRLYPCHWSMLTQILSQFSRGYIVSRHQPALLPCGIAKHPGAAGLSWAAGESGFTSG